MALVNKKFLTNVNLVQNELQNAVIQVLASAPETPKEGQIYYDSTKHEFGYRANGSWKYVTEGGYSLPEAEATVLGGVKLAKHLGGSKGKEPEVVNFTLSGEASAGGHKIKELETPTLEKDAANKKYVDEKAYTLPEATETVLGGIKLAGDIKGGTGAAPHVTNLHLEGNTEINHKLTKLSTPTEAEDAANKAYVDGKINGVAWKAPAYVATTSALPACTVTNEKSSTETLEANSNGTLTIDGKEPAVGKRVLVKNQAAAKNDGIYEMLVKGEAGAKWKMIRTADSNTVAELQDATLFVEVGTTNEGTAWNQSATIATIGETSQVWVEIQSATKIVTESTYLERSGNELKVKPFTSYPAIPTAGEVSAAKSGASRKVSFAIKGNNSKTEFTLTHSLETRLLLVQAQEVTGGEPGNPVEIGWEPTSASAIKISFAVKPPESEAGEYFITIIG